MLFHKDEELVAEQQRKTWPASVLLRNLKSFIFLLLKRGLVSEDNIPQTVMQLHITNDPALQWNWFFYAA